jgi:hypothetical protein
MSERNDPKVEIESLSDDDLESASGGLREIVNSGTGTCVENSGTGTCGS